MNYIKVNHLTKVINNNTVLDDINFELKQGGIYSFIGHNGSGKTMLLGRYAVLLRQQVVKLQLMALVLAKLDLSQKRPELLLKRQAF